jgi:hypothetical protein
VAGAACPVQYSHMTIRDLSSLLALVLGMLLVLAA